MDGQGGKRPDGARLLPWARGKPLAWDITVPDTYAESHLHDTACRPGAAADKAAANKSSKYHDLAGTHLFFPVAIETAGTWNRMAVELVQEIGRRITLVTEDSRETVLLFQRLSIALQRGNAVSFHSTFTTEYKRRCGLTCLVFNISYLRQLSTEGFKNNNRPNNMLYYNNCKQTTTVIVYFTI